MSKDLPAASVVMVAPLQFHPRTEATVQGSLGRRVEGLVGQVEEAQALEVRRGGQGQPAFLADAVVPQEQGGQVGQVGRGGQGDRPGVARVIAGQVEAGDAGEARGLGDGPGPRGAEGTAAQAVAAQVEVRNGVMLDSFEASNSARHRAS